MSQRRPLSDLCCVIMDDTDAGLALSIENKDPRDITLRFDFSGCKDLEMKIDSSEGAVEDAGPMKCNTIAKSGTTFKLCDLVVAAGATSFEMKYRVQCLVKNEKGELEQVKPPGAGGGAGGSGGSAGATTTSSSAAAPQAEEEGEEIRKIYDDLFLILAPGPNHGYKILFTSTNTEKSYLVSLDFSSSENLDVNAEATMETENETTVNGEIDPGVERIPFASLPVKDLSLGSCSIKYKIQYRAASEDDSSDDGGAPQDDGVKTKLTVAAHLR